MEMNKDTVVVVVVVVAAAAAAAVVVINSKQQYCKQYCPSEAIYYKAFGL